jgi:type IV pilus assembly protein PilQ
MKRSRRMKTHGFGITIAAAALLVFAAGAIPQETDPEAAADPAVDFSEAAQPASTSQDAPVGNTSVEMVRPDTFDVHVKDADLRGVLQLLATQGRKNIIASRGVSGDVTIDLYGVTFDRALKAVLDATGYTKVEKDGFIYIYTPEEYASIKEASREREVKLFRLAYITAEDARALITPALSERGSISLSPAAATGISTSTTEAGGNSYASQDLLIINDFPENLERVDSLLKELDVRPQQVVIEATILQAKLDENNGLGIDFTALSGVDFRQLNGSTDFSGVTTDAASGDMLDNQMIGLSTGFSSNVSTGGLQFGYVNNEIGMFLRALEGVTDTTVLANPKLIVLNKHRGQVGIVKRDGYLTTTVTDTVATQTVDFLETGTMLVVRPFIGRDGFIRMEIHPEDSSGSVSLIGNSALPTETQTEVTSNVLVRDGHTIVIGGLFRESTTTGRSQVPGVGNLPYVGSLFRSTSDTIKREEVIILITPHIVDQDAAEGVGEQVRGEVEKMCIGARKGLSWFGREKLAMTHVRWARKEIRLGRKDRALWHVDIALSYAPRLMDAIRMKERLTEQEYWNSKVHVGSARYLLQRMIMEDMGKPASRIVPPHREGDVDKMDDKVRERFGVTKSLVDPWRGTLESDEKAIEPRRDEKAIKEDDEQSSHDELIEDEAQIEAEARRRSDEPAAPQG